MTGPYTAAMVDEAQSEDWRGVDVGQIRAQLRLPVRDRVRVMVEAANTMLAANRLKDQRDLPYLESLRDEIG